MLEFHIPIHFEDVSLASNDKYTVKKIIDLNSQNENTILSNLDLIYERIKKDSSDIVDHQCFDSLFSYVLHIGKLTADQRNQIIKILKLGITNITTTINKELTNNIKSNNNNKDEEDNDESEDESITTSQSKINQDFKSKCILYRNALKMYIFFLEHYISYQHSSASKESSKETSTATAPAKKTVAKKKTTSNTMDNWEVEEFKESILSIIIKLFELNLSILWRLDYPEEEFINLISKIIYAMIEQPANLRSKGVKKLIFQILSIFILKYNHSFNFTSKVIHLLHHHESLSSHFADLYEFIQQYQNEQQKQLKLQQNNNNNIYSQPTTQKNQTTFLISDIIREIGKQKEQRDTSGFKNLAKFLSELTDRLPKTVLPFVSLLLVHLDSDSYLMRNAVTESIGYLIGKALNSDNGGDQSKSATDENNDEEDQEQENSKKREADKVDLLNILFERFRDTNGYCRSSVLKTMSLLVNNNWIPRDSYIQLTKHAIERVSDKNSQVRRRAIILVSDILESNPYSPFLPTALFKEKKDKLDSYIKLSTYNLTVKKRKQQQQQSNKDADGDTNIEDQSQEVPDDEDETNERSNNYDDDDSDEESKIKEKDIYEDIKLNKEQFFDLISQLVPFSGIKEFSQHRLPFMMEHLNKYLTSTCKFIEAINGTIETMCQLMGSVNPTDTLESIHFIEVAHKYKIDKSKEAISKMLALIWNKEQSIKDSTIRAFHELLIKDTRDKVKSTLKSSYYIAKNLIDLTTTATLGEITSLEELVIEFMKRSLIDQDVINALWDIFAGKVVNFDKQDSRGAIIILSMAANNNSHIVKDKISLLISIGLEQQDDEYLPRYTCITLQKLRSKSLTKHQLSDQQLTQQPIIPRFKNNQSLFERLIFHITNNHSNGDHFDSNGKWFMFAEQAINTIYTLAEQPDLISSEIIRKLSNQILIEQQQQISPSQQQQQDTTNSTTDSLILSRLIFLLGHIAIKQLVYVEEIQSELKRIRYEKSIKKKQNKEKKPKPTAATSKKGGRKGKQVVEEEQEESDSDEDDDKKKSNIEKELGTDQAEEETEFERIQNQAESDILSESNLIGKYSPLVISICYNHNGMFGNESLQTSAVLTLSKFMCVDSKFCEANLQLLFTLLETSTTEVIRSNIIIGLGDLAFRFPNLVEPWTSKIYSRLRDTDSKARKNSLMVLTHLILNDMIKVKGQISEMAICLEDSDPRISSIAKLFFSTLASKGNNLYNSLPDIIGKLTPTSSVTSNLSNVSKDSIKNILKYLFSFIEKDKQNETLVDKLVQRFKISKSIYESQNISYCLQLLNYNDKALKKLLEHFKLYQDKLVDNEVYNNLVAAIGKTKKQQNLSKTTEIKQLVDELEKKIEAVRANNIDAIESSNIINSTGGGNTSQSKPSIPSKPGKKAAAKKKAAATVSTPRKKSKVETSSEEEEDDDDESESEEDSSSSSDDDDDDKMEVDEKKKSKPSIPKPIPLKRSKPLPKKVDKSSSEEEEEEDKEDSSGSSSESDNEPIKPAKKQPAKRSKPLPKKVSISSSEEEVEDSSSESDNELMEITPAKKQPAKRSAPIKKPPPKSTSKKIAPSRLKKAIVESESSQESEDDGSESSSFDVSD